MPERIIEGDALFELKTLPQLVSGYSNQCKNRHLILLNFILIKSSNYQV